MRMYLCTEGRVKFQTRKGGTQLEKYQSLLMPAEIDSYKIIPEKDAVLIEVVIP